MPIFEYICRECGQAFETIVTGAREAECPSCTSRSLEKQLSVFAVSASTTPHEAPPAAARGCCRCGVPNGPCSMN